MIKIDTHFHPNFTLFSDKLTEKRAKKIWNEVEKMGLDYLFVTEHAFKQPVRQYFLLKKYRPENIKTILIPWVEALTKEWIDIIVFSKNESIYSYKEIVTPKYFTLNELIDFVNSKPDLYCIVTHPYNTSDTAVIWHYNKDELKEFVKKSWFIEKHNACWYQAQMFFEKVWLDKLLTKLYKRFLYTWNVPENNYFEDTVIMWWSDAHHPEYLWDYLLIKTDNKCFESIIDKKYKREFVFNKNRKNFLIYLLKNAITVSIEWIIKRFGLYKLYRENEKN